MIRSGIHAPTVDKGVLETVLRRAQLTLCVYDQRNMKKKKRAGARAHRIFCLCSFFFLLAQAL